MTAAHTNAALADMVGHVRATSDTVMWGRLPAPSDSPVATVNSGDLLRLDTLSHEGALPDQGSDPLGFFARHGLTDVLPDLVECAQNLDRDPIADGPHFVTGPVAVRGAMPGDLLRIDVVSLHRRCDYGVVSNRHYKDIFAAEPALRSFTPRELSYEVVHVTARDHREFAAMPGFPDVALEPFLGIMGVAQPGNERPHSGPPGSFGGNLDLTYLTEGSTLFLPIQVEGALFYVGDPHFVQGNGEIASTALEAPLTATVRLSLVPSGATEGRVSGPVALSNDKLVICGLDRDLGRSARLATAQTLTLFEGCGQSSQESLLWLSMAGDLEVTQVVDGVIGTHMVCPAEAFAPLIENWAPDLSFCTVNPDNTLEGN
ncbi:acetamidase/formamidase family protein [Gordonia sp. NPDC003376]